MVANGREHSQRRVFLPGGERALTARIEIKATDQSGRAGLHDERAAASTHIQLDERSPPTTGKEGWPPIRSQPRCPARLCFPLIFSAEHGLKRGARGHDENGLQKRRKYLTYFDQ